jgi:hypothetical protein
MKDDLQLQIKYIYNMIDFVNFLDGNKDHDFCKHIQLISITFAQTLRTCSAYLTAPDAPRSCCMTCLKADCAFCANAASEVSSFTFLSPSAIQCIIFLHDSLPH